MSLAKVDHAGLLSGQANSIYTAPIHKKKKIILASERWGDLPKNLFKMEEPSNRALLYVDRVT